MNEYENDLFSYLLQLFLVAGYISSSLTRVGFSFTSSFFFPPKEANLKFLKAYKKDWTFYLLFYNFLLLDKSNTIALTPKWLRLHWHLTDKKSLLVKGNLQMTVDTLRLLKQSKINFWFYRSEVTISSLISIRKKMNWMAGNTA